MNSLKCYVTRRYNGLYLVTALKPKHVQVAGTDHTDAYIRYGDPIGYINVSKLFAESVFGDMSSVTSDHRRAILYGRVPTLQEEMTHILEADYDIEKMTFGTGYSIHGTGCSIYNICPWFVKKMFEIDTMWPKPCPLIFKGELVGV